MSLRTKVLLILTLTVLSYAGADHLLQRTQVFDTYVALEEAEAERDLQRVVESIHAEILHLDDLCRSWAAWDDTCAYLEEPTQRFVDSNLSDTTILDRRRLNLVMICDAEGSVRFQRMADLESREEIRIRKLPRGALAPNHPLIRIDDVEGKVRGVYPTEHGPMLVSARPILTSQGEGPIRGTVILGKLLDRALVEDLSTQVSVEFDVFDENSSDLAEAEEEIRTQLTVSAWAATQKEELDPNAEYPRTSFTDDPEEDREIYHQAYFETDSVTQIVDDEMLHRPGRPGQRTRAGADRRCRDRGRRRDYRASFHGHRAVGCRHRRRGVEAGPGARTQGARQLSGASSLADARTDRAAG